MVFYHRECVIPFLLRYGHGSCLLHDGSILVVGGYGESSKVGPSPHSRLNDTLKLLLDDSNGWELCNLDTEGIHPGVNLFFLLTCIQFVGYIKGHSVIS